MKIIELEQRSPEWLAWRRNGITATDICVLTGNHPRGKTRRQLWHEKCGYVEPEPPNEAMMYGSKQEESVRQWIQDKHGIVIKDVCVEGEKPHYLASLDGWCEERSILFEIKCPFSKKNSRKVVDEQIIPPYWLDQIHWQAFISKPKKTFLSVKDFESGEVMTIPIFINMAKVQEIKQLADDFWLYIERGIEPDAENSDYESVVDPQLANKLQAYQGVSEQIKGLETQKKGLKKEIESFGHGNSFQAYGYKIRKMDSPTSYDFEKMKQDGIDLSKYIKPGNAAGYYKIIPPKL